MDISKPLNSISAPERLIMAIRISTSALLFTLVFTPFASATPIIESIHQSSSLLQIRVSGYNSDPEILTDQDFGDDISTPVFANSLEFPWSVNSFVESNGNTVSSNYDWRNESDRIVFTASYDSSIADPDGHSQRGLLSGSWGFHITEDVLLRWTQLIVPNIFTGHEGINSTIVVSGTGEGGNSFHVQTDAIRLTNSALSPYYIEYETLLTGTTDNFYNFDWQTNLEATSGELSATSLLKLEFIQVPVPEPASSLILMVGFLILSLFKIRHFPLIHPKPTHPL